MPKNSKKDSIITCTDSDLHKEPVIFTVGSIAITISQMRTLEAERGESTYLRAHSWNGWGLPRIHKANLRNHTFILQVK